jgi:Tol biopolymer transport system component
MRQDLLTALAVMVSAVSCAPSSGSGAKADAADPSIAVPAEPGEPRLKNVRQLTFGGENAEAYWSSDGKWITFQSTRDGRTCDQQYVMRANGSDLHRISAGGKTTCGYFYDHDRRVFFASTHGADTACPPRPDASAGYVWPLDRFDIYTANPDGSDLRRLTNYGVYTAEAVLSPDGKQIVFTSLKDGDLDIYTMNLDGSNVRQLTNTRGYDGGPWWSPDGKQIVYRAHHVADSADRAEYDRLLAQHLVKPSKVELFVMNADGSDQKQITHLGGANFGPSWTPDGKQIIFSSNYTSPRSGNFDLYLINRDGSGLEQLTKREEFDGFPMFSPDGKRVIWASNRHGKTSGETNLFVAEWSQ